jgi:hypothetical protein
MIIHAISGDWLKFAALNVINVLLLLLIFVWEKQPLILSWIVVAASAIILCFAPVALSSSMTLLTLFLCYTLLPLQLKPSALAAIIITLLALIIQFFHYAKPREVSIWVYSAAKEKLPFPYIIRGTPKRKKVGARVKNTKKCRQ